MRLPKRYGMSQESGCPFCGKQATTENKQGIPVCEQHRREMFPDIKCTCGEWLDLKKGKFGSYFHCFNCGNISWSKGLEMADLTKTY